MKLIVVAFLFITCKIQLFYSRQLGYKDLVFVIISQKDVIYNEKALALERDIKEQTNNMSIVYLTHRDIKHVGDWTVVPILERLWSRLEGKFSWMFFCTDQTKFNLKNIISSVSQLNFNETFIGRALTDSEPTIIHHFASIKDFQYPLFASGFGLSHDLLKRLMVSLDNNIFKKIDFSIDASHELALFIKKKLNGTLLVNNDKFCLDYRDDCATYVSKNELCDELDISNIFFAVKTCQKFHSARVPIVQATWGNKCRHITFFSETFDEKIPTVKLDVQNTEIGHCAKTEAIFKTTKQYLLNNTALQWVVLADDDTILSVRRIQKLVGCFNSNEPIILGERYGYSVWTENGYNYITGGGGAILSRRAIMKLAGSNCLCPSESTPDDMFLLGICVERLKITMIHIPQFHQARPEDYNSEYLKIGEPISFHKHWMTDPIKLYKDWFEDFDFLKSDHYMHTDL